MNLILIRHAESEANVDRSIYTWQLHHNIMLTEKGKSQSKVLGYSIRNTFTSLLKLNPKVKTSFYISPYNRTRETFNIASKEFEDIKDRINIVYDATIHEHVCGSNHDEISKLQMDYDLYEDNIWYKENGSESLADVYARAKAFLTSLKINHSDDETVFVVSHAGFLSMLEGILTNVEPEVSIKTLRFNNAEMKHFKVDVK